MEIKHTRKVTVRTWEEKQALCEQWKASGKTKSEFCKENQIPLATFFPWCNKMWPEAKKQEINIAPVKITNKFPFLPERADQIEVELSLGEATAIRFKLPVTGLVPFIQELSHATATIR